MIKYSLKLISILIILIIFNKNLFGIENEILFKVNNKSFTTFDFEQRKQYLEFVGDNSNIDIEIAKKDFISVIIFNEYYNNKNIKYNLDEKIEEIFNNIYEQKNSNQRNEIKENRKNIIFNLKLDLIRKSVIEEILNNKELFSVKRKEELLYNFEISYISLTIKILKL